MFSSSPTHVEYWAYGEFDGDQNLLGGLAIPWVLLDLWALFTLTKSGKSNSSITLLRLISFSHQALMLMPSAFYTYSDSGMMRESMVVEKINVYWITLHWQVTAAQNHKNEWRRARASNWYSAGHEKLSGCWDIASLMKWQWEEAGYEKDGVNYNIH